jgi:hypothetical protein
MTNGNGHGQAKGKEPVERVMDLFVHMPIGLAVMAWKRVPEFVSSVPDLVGQALSKGCGQIAGAEERISEEVRKARMIGEVAVTFGGRQLRREVDARLRDARQAAGGVASFLNPPVRPNGAGARPQSPTVDTAATPAEPTVTVMATPAEPASPPKVATPPRRASSSNKAPAAAPKRASSPKKAPAATRAAPAKKAPAVKKTAAADLPIREYDGLSASQVVSRLTGLTPDELQAVRSYEEGSRGRRTVLLAIDRILG